MKKVMTVFGAIMIALIILTSCGGSSSKESTEIITDPAVTTEVSVSTSEEPTAIETEGATKEKTDGATKEKAEGLSIEFLGNYHGIQPSYFMKNQYGDEMIIRGNKIPISSVDYKFLLKENNVVSLQQIKLEDNSRVYYDGTYKILTDDSNTTKIECSLHDDEISNPTYILTISKIDKKGTCTGRNEPEFSIEKTK